MSSAPVVDFSLSTVGPAVAWADEIAKARAEAISGEPDWEPLPWQEKAIADEAPVVLLTGTVGSGKTRTWIEMVHNFCKTYEGAFWLVAREDP